MGRIEEGGSRGSSGISQAEVEVPVGTECCELSNRVDPIIIACTSFNGKKKEATAILTGVEQMASIKPPVSEREFNGLARPRDIVGLKLVQAFDPIDFNQRLVGVMAAMLSGERGDNRNPKILDAVRKRLVRAIETKETIYYTATDILELIDHPGFRSPADALQPESETKADFMNQLWRYMVANPYGFGTDEICIIPASLSGGMGVASLQLEFVKKKDDPEKFTVYDANLIQLMERMIFHNLHITVGQIKTPGFYYRTMTAEELELYASAFWDQARYVNAGVMWEVLHFLIVQADGIDRGAPGFDQKIEQILNITGGVPVEMLKIMGCVDKSMFSRKDDEALRATIRSLTSRIMSRFTPVVDLINWHIWYPSADPI